MPKASPVILPTSLRDYTHAADVLRRIPISIGDDKPWEVTAASKAHVGAIDKAKQAALASANPEALKTAIESAYKEQAAEAKALYTRLEEKIALFGLVRNFNHKNLLLAKLKETFQDELKQLHEKHLASINKLYDGNDDLKKTQLDAQEKLYNAQKARMEKEFNDVLAYHASLGDRFQANTLALATLDHSGQYPDDAQVSITNHDIDAKLSNNATYKTKSGKEFKIENGTVTATYSRFQQNDIFGKEKLRGDVRDQIAAAIALGKSQGKKGIDISCTYTKTGKPNKQMGSLCWQEAVMMGIEPEDITGYKPSKEDMEWYKKVKAARDQAMQNLANAPSALTVVDMLEQKNELLSRATKSSEDNLKRFHDAYFSSTRTVPTIDEMQKLTTELEDISNTIEQQLQLLQTLKSAVIDPTPEQHKAINELADKLNANMNKFFDAMKNPMNKTSYQALLDAGKNEVEKKLKADPDNQKLQGELADWKNLSERLPALQQASAGQATRIPQPGQFLPPGPVPAATMHKP